MTAESKNKYLVEIVGTFILVYAICSAATVYSTNVPQGIAGLGQLGIIGVGLVHALVLTAIVYAIGYRSGAQVNPAVTIGLLVARKMGRTEAGLTIACQILGAVIARCSLFNVWKRNGSLVSHFLQTIMLLEHLYWKPS